ncbi:DUF6907 domain-containing protein [Streptomyces rochei]|uniref:DUF6907 domain-containing protein n=1 Tax=Streptomyces rochei TaxID=1928 RepID=UPI0036C99DEC
MSGHPRTHVRPGQPLPTDTPGHDDGQASGQCPPWCTIADHRPDDDHHEGVSIAFVGPGDDTGYFDDGEPYEVLWAALASRGDGPPHIYFDTQGQATGAHLDLAQTDALLADLHQYTARLQQMRNRLAEILKEQP